MDSHLKDVLGVVPSSETTVVFKCSMNLILGWTACLGIRSGKAWSHGMVLCHGGLIPDILFFGGSGVRPL